MDIRYTDKQGAEVSLYEVDEFGQPAFLVITARRMEPPGLEQWFWRVWDDLADQLAPYLCGCGGHLSSWPAVMDHCGLYPCRDCRRATVKYHGWDFRCPSCDVAANPDYHRRNPGYYGGGGGHA